MNHRQSPHAVLHFGALQCMSCGVWQHYDFNLLDSSHRVHLYDTHGHMGAAESGPVQKGSGSKLS